MVLRNKRKSMLVFSEMEMFAGFNPKVQRYIRISLCIAFEKEEDPVDLCSRTPEETDEIRERQRMYTNIDHIARCLREQLTRDNFAHFVGYIIPIASYDLSHGVIYNFSQFLFLYERIFGAKIRMYLPMIYSAAAASPLINGDVRSDLFDNIHISEATAPASFWSTEDSRFMPEWVDKVPEKI